MTKENLFAALGGMDEALVTAALAPPPARLRARRRWALGLAAALALALAACGAAAAAGWFRFTREAPQNPDGQGLTFSDPFYDFITPGRDPAETALIAKDQYGLAYCFDAQGKAVALSPLSLDFGTFLTHMFSCGADLDLSVLGEYFFLTASGFPCWRGEDIELIGGSEPRIALTTDREAPPAQFQAVFQQPEPGRWLNLNFVIYEASEELPVVIPQDAAIEQWEAEGWQDVRFFSLDTPTGKDYTLLAYRPLPQPLENRYFIRDLGRAVDGGLPKARTLERCVLCVTLSRADEAEARALLRSLLEPHRA